MQKEKTWSLPNPVASSGNETITIRHWLHHYLPTAKAIELYGWFETDIRNSIAYIQLLATMPVDTTSPMHSWTTKWKLTGKRIWAMTLETNNKENLILPSARQPLGSAPCFWHMALPHILPTHQSKAKSQTYPQRPQNKTQWTITIKLWVK